MPGPITYAAVTLLARDRLGQVIRTLRAKRDQGTAKELELHVLGLGEQAHEMLSASEPTIAPPVRLYGPPLTDGVSRFALLGSVGPDLPRYATPFAAEQQWLFHTLHKGTPDEQREKVLAHSTDLVFELFRQASSRIDGEISKPKEQDRARQNLRAYVLGHLCHVAADVLAHPYFESLEATLGPGRKADKNLSEATRRLSRDEVAGGFDRRLARDFFNRGEETRDKKWADWFPPAGDVPKAFREGMAAAIVAEYGARPAGLPAFETAFSAIDPQPPALDADLIGDALKNFRSLIGIGRTWDYWDWFGAMSPVFVPMLFAYPAALALTEAKDLTRSLDGPDKESREATRLYEQVTFPFAIGSLGPLVMMIIVSAAGRGLRAEGVTGWINAVLQIAATVGFFATLGGAGGARWTLFFVLPLVFGLFQMIFSLARGSSKNLRALLWMGPALQILIGLAFLLCYSTFLHEGVEEWQKDKDRDDLEAWGLFAIWGGIVVALWFFFPIFGRYVFSDHLPEDVNRFLPTEPRRYLTLYDDVALVHDPQAAAGSQSLEHLLYPWSRRPMLKLWWTGGAPKMTLRADHDRLVFRLAGAAPAADQTVFAPAIPVSFERFAAQLEAVVRDGGGSTGKLKAQVVLDTERGLEVAAGEIFADHGDGEDRQGDHDDLAATFQELGADEAGAFLLHHAPRHRLAVRMGTRGPALGAVRTVAASVAGSRLQPHPGGDPRRFVATGAPLLRRLFQPGDVLQAATAPPQQRIVVEVASDTELVVASPFTPAIAAAGVAYSRLASDRSAPLPGGANRLFTPTLATGIRPNDLQGSAGTVFGQVFRPGDTIVIRVPLAGGAVGVRRRRVVAVKDGALVGAPPVATPLIELDAPLDLTIPSAAIPAAPLPPPGTVTGPAPFERAADEDADGFAFVADENDVFGEGGSILNDAADLAALLCLAGASRLAPNNQPATPAGAAKPPKRVYQVFRNWNLDRRRINEWQLLVAGGAVSERRGDFKAADEAAPIDRGDELTTASDALIAKRRDGERIARERGVLPIFRDWVEMAGRPRNDVTAEEVFRPGEPTNRDLSRALAYLLDADEAATP